MHRNEQSDLEPLDELPGTKGIAVADTSIYGKHHHIETVGNLADVLQLAKELLFVSYRIERLFHLKAVSFLVWIIVCQELGIPVVQVARMEEAFDLWSSLLTLGRVQASLALLSLNRSLVLSLNNPRHAAVCAA